MNPQILQITAIIFLTFFSFTGICQDIDFQEQQELRQALYGQTPIPGCFNYAYQLSQFDELLENYRHAIDKQELIEAESNLVKIYRVLRCATIAELERPSETIKQFLLEHPAKENADFLSLVVLLHDLGIDTFTSLHNSWLATFFEAHQDNFAATYMARGENLIKIDEQEQYAILHGIYSGHVNADLCSIEELENFANSETLICRKAVCDENTAKNNLAVSLGETPPVLSHFNSDIYKDEQDIENFCQSNNNGTGLTDRQQADILKCAREHLQSTRSDIAVCFSKHNKNKRFLACLHNKNFFRANISRQCMLGKPSLIDPDGPVPVVVNQMEVLFRKLNQVNKDITVINNTIEHLDKKWEALNTDIATEEEFDDGSVETEEKIKKLKKERDGIYQRQLDLQKKREKLKKQKENIEKSIETEERNCAKKGPSDVKTCKEAKEEGKKRADNKSQGTNNRCSPEDIDCNNACGPRDEFEDLRKCVIANSKEIKPVINDTPQPVDPRVLYFGPDSPHFPEQNLSSDFIACINKATETSTTEQNSCSAVLNCADGEMPIKNEEGICQCPNNGNLSLPQNRCQHAIRCELGSPNCTCPSTTPSGIPPFNGPRDTVFDIIEG
ncbi:hypothetical protein [Agarilytica rhodophyticola]|uniref:hypothetical protein n=1 Tax=Agarilytica rhodophyticola TaxID=1737490 RepID=UPI000B346F84|nr:hypothetical protein [Agarilytica rhodophyticola]